MMAESFLLVPAFFDLKKVSDTTWSLDDYPLPIVETAQILGLHFDSHLT